MDPCFKALRIVKSLVGYENVVKLASKYDAKIMILILIVCFEWFNPNIVATTTTKDDAGLEFEEKSIWSGASIVESF